MTAEEFSNQFDVLYNNITSNQAPGLNEYEKSVFLTKAQDEIVKNYFTTNSKGNNIGQGFDDSPKRQADFAGLMKTYSLILERDHNDESKFPKIAPFIYHKNIIEGDSGNLSIPSTVSSEKIGASVTIKLPSDIMVILNETTKVDRGNRTVFLVTVPIRYDEYDRLASKPYKRPLKNQAWRMIANENSIADIVVGPSDKFLQYLCRYVRHPKPIIVGPLDGLSINEYVYSSDTQSSGQTPTAGCELSSNIHEEILQRAVELAKIAWTATGQENVQLMMQAGQRSE